MLTQLNKPQSSDNSASMALAHTHAISAKSPALQRLIDEVRNNKTTSVGGRYDRTHNRHNRGQ